MLAIRREDQSVWERRAPFNPHVVRQFVKNGVKVLVQPSNRRAYPMQVTIKNIVVGAKIISFFKLKIFTSTRLLSQNLLK